MKKLLALFLIFGIISCASNALLRFPVAQYIDDVEAVELRFACITKSDVCIHGLYIDNMQVHEAFGDYTIFNTGMNPKNTYKFKLPRGKYKFSGSGPGANPSLDRYLNITSDSCAILIADTHITIFNAFDRLKPNELVWSLIECNKFNELTKGFEEIELYEPIYYTNQKQ